MTAAEGLVFDSFGIFHINEQVRRHTHWGGVACHGATDIPKGIDNSFVGFWQKCEHVFLKSGNLLLKRVATEILVSRHICGDRFRLSAGTAD